MSVCVTSYEAESLRQSKLSYFFGVYLYTHTHTHTYIHVYTYTRTKLPQTHARKHIFCSCQVANHIHMTSHVTLISVYLFKNYFQSRTVDSCRYSGTFFPNTFSRQLCKASVDILHLLFDEPRPPDLCRYFASYSSKTFFRRSRKSSPQWSLLRQHFSQRMLQDVKVLVYVCVICIYIYIIRHCMHHMCSVVPQHAKVKYMDVCMYVCMYITLYESHVQCCSIPLEYMYMSVCVHIYIYIYIYIKVLLNVCVCVCM